VVVVKSEVVWLCLCVLLIYRKLKAFLKRSIGSTGGGLYRSLRVFLEKLWAANPPPQSLEANT
jgi:hypothetical protein